MIKVAILGIDNSHAWAFAGALANKDGSKLFEDVELIGMYGDYDTEDGKIAMAEIAKCSSCSNYAAHYNDFLDEADAILVTARHGKFHLEYAREYIKKGIPVWIDKPFTCSPETLCEMLDLAKECGCTITGGSDLPHLPIIKEAIAETNAFSKILGGHVTAPIHMNSPYGDFWFYAQHLVQMITSVFGTEVRSVRAFRENDGVTALYSFDDFTVTARFGSGYTVLVYGEDNKIVQKEIISSAEHFVTALHVFYDVIKSGKSDMTYREMAAPVYIIDATIKAYTEGKEVSITLPY